MQIILKYWSFYENCLKIEDAPNHDFESRNGEKWRKIPWEDKFILKCIERRKKDKKFGFKEKDYMIEQN
jgi:hypothetical protein